MKKIIRLACFMLVGFVIGVAGVGAGMLLFTDMTWQHFWEKLLAIDFSIFLGNTLWGIILFIVAAYLQIILHEGGHLVFGLSAGFRFVSFRVGSWTLIRQNGKFRVKRFAVAGTGGQCLLSPPDKGITPAAFALYNMGGVLMNFLTALVAFWIWIVCKPLLESPGSFLFFFYLVGFLLALTNGIPLRMSGINNDGYNMLLIMRRDKRTMQGLQTQFRINALLQEGTRIKDMPAEWFVDEPVTDYKDVLQVGERTCLAGRYMDRKEYDQSRRVYDELLEHKSEIIGLYVKEITCEVLLLELIGECRKEEIEKLYTPDIKEYIAQYKKVMSGKQALTCALALYWEDKPKEARKIYEQLVQQKDKYLMQGEVASSIELMEDMLSILVKKTDSMQ